MEPCIRWTPNPFHAGKKTIYGGFACRIKSGCAQWWMQLQTWMCGGDAALYQLTLDTCCSAVSLLPSRLERMKV